MTTPRVRGCVIAHASATLRARCASVGLPPTTPSSPSHRCAARAILMVVLARGPPQASAPSHAASNNFAKMVVTK